MYVGDTRWSGSHSSIDLLHICVEGVLASPLMKIEVLTKVRLDLISGTWRSRSHDKPLFSLVMVQHFPAAANPRFSLPSPSTLCVGESYLERKVSRAEPLPFQDILKIPLVALFGCKAQN